MFPTMLAMTSRDITVATAGCDSDMTQFASTWLRWKSQDIIDIEVGIIEGCFNYTTIESQLRII